MRYYTYVSRTKVEMLYPQVVHPRASGLAAELSVNLGVVGGKVSSPKSADPSLYERAEAIHDHLKREDKVGTVQDPKSYFAGAFAPGAASAHRGSGRNLDYGQPEYREVVIWLGTFEATIVLLVGSAHSQVGHPEPLKGCHGFNDYVEEAFNAMAGGLEEIRREYAVGPDRVPSQDAAELDPPGDFWGAVQALNRQQKPHAKRSWLRKDDQCRVAFLARRIAHTTVAGESILVGTPIYVAAEDDD